MDLRGEEMPSPEPNGEELQEVRGWLLEAESVLVLTGAGISAESGVPTFRGGGVEPGLWDRYRPEELATPEAFARDPELVWGWYSWRRTLVGDCRPNPAHEALARFAAGRRGVHLVTQNVDHLHEEAARNLGSSLLPLHLHGSLFRDRCSGCGKEWDVQPKGPHGTMPLPRCESCHSLLRPGVVWFGEMLDAGELDVAARLAQQAALTLVVGTSGLVYPAAGLPRVTLEAGGRVVEVNLEPTPLTPQAHRVFLGSAARLLPLLLDG